MSMTQEKMYMNVDDVCAVLGVSKAFAYKIMKGYNWYRFVLKHMYPKSILEIQALLQKQAMYPLPRQSFTFFRPSLTSWESGVKMVSDMHYMMCIIKCLYNGGQ